MPRRATYAGTPREKSRYRQRVHAWTRKGLVEGVDWALKDGIPIRLRGPAGQLPTAGRPHRNGDRQQTPADAPSDADLHEMTEQAIVDLPYEASIRVYLLRRKHDLADATAGGILHPIDQLPPLPPTIQEEIRYAGDLLAAYLSKHHPHPYGADGS